MEGSAPTDLTAGASNNDMDYSAQIEQRPMRSDFKGLWQFLAPVGPRNSSMVGFDPLTAISRIEVGKKRFRLVYMPVCLTALDLIDVCL
ncbi:uncharacterized protein P174DRAFT_445406, partial [Aspergillus novofumigatus IBT 16806]